MKNLLLVIITILSFNVKSQGNGGGGPSGGACVFIDGSGDVHCTIYGNSGVPSETACYNDALSQSAQPINCGDYLLPCVSQIFGNGSYCFFVGNSDCVASICESIALPVELVSFDVVNEDDYNIIKWVTISEYNSSHFILSHFIEGEDKTDLYVIPANGFTNETINYYTKHYYTNDETNYYTLFQYDLDGKYEVYGPISIDNRKIEKRIVKKINLLGQTVDDYYRGIVIEVYDDGTTKKVYK
jgi:hypothetical protein